MKLKRLMVFALSTALTFGSVMTASAAWVQEGANWKYQNGDGSWQVGRWFKDVDSRSYHFDANGMVQKGWFLDTDGKWYFMDYAGVMQVGLIKVDNAVYYMNDSGDLFIGDKVINGATYTFGLYGTTKGTPGVTQDRTYGGNGNQTLSSGGGGGSSSNPGGGKQTPSEKVDGAVKEVKDAANSAADAATATIDKITVGNPVSTGDNTAKVDVPVEMKSEVSFEDEGGKNIAEVKTAIGTVIESVLEDVPDEAEVTVVIPGITFNSGGTITVASLNEKKDDLLSAFVTANNYKKENKSAAITVPVNGVMLTYNISLQ